ncbi:hypothetical protein ACFL17_07140, partial [Pseudomonadota bacterium]
SSFEYERCLRLSCNMSCGNPDLIIEALDAEFNVKIVTEYEPEYWGFSTHEEWEAWAKEEAKVADQKHYEMLIKHSKGEQIEYGSSTVGYAKANIAKELIEKDPTLGLPERKDDLLDMVEKTDSDRRRNKVKITPTDWQWAEAISTPDDEWPQA